MAVAQIVSEEDPFLATALKTPPEGVDPFLSGASKTPPAGVDPFLSEASKTPEDAQKSALEAPLSDPFRKPIPPPSVSGIWGSQETAAALQRKRRDIDPNRGVISKIWENFTRGKETTQMAQAMGLGLLHGVDIGDIRNSLHQYQELEQSDPVTSNNWLAKGAYQAANMMYPMVQSMGTKMAGAALFGGGAFLVGLIPGLQAEEVAVPAAAAAGWKWGGLAGGMTPWYLQGVGQFYDDFRNKGFDHDTAKEMALAGGAPYAAMAFLNEFIPIESLMPGAEKAVSTGIRGVLGRLVGSAGKTLPSSIGQAAGRVALQAGSETLRASLSMGGMSLVESGTQALGALTSQHPELSPEFGSALKDAYEATVSALTPTALMALPGAALRMNRGVQEVKFRGAMQRLGLTEEQSFEAAKRLGITENAETTVLSMMQSNPETYKALLDAKAPARVFNAISTLPPEHRESVALAYKKGFEDSKGDSKKAAQMASVAIQALGVTQAEVKSGITGEEAISDKEGGIGVRGGEPQGEASQPTVLVKETSGETAPTDRIFQTQQVEEPSPKKEVVEQAQSTVSITKPGLPAETKAMSPVAAPAIDLSQRVKDRTAPREARTDVGYEGQITRLASLSPHELMARSSVRFISPEDSEVRRREAAEHTVNQQMPNAELTEKAAAVDQILSDMKPFVAEFNLRTGENSFGTQSTPYDNFHETSHAVGRVALQQLPFKYLLNLSEKLQPAWNEVYLNDIRAGKKERASFAFHPDGQSTFWSKGMYEAFAEVLQEVIRRGTGGKSKLIEWIRNRSPEVAEIFERIASWITQKRYEPYSTSKFTESIFSSDTAAASTMRKIIDLQAEVEHGRVQGKTGKRGVRKTREARELRFRELSQEETQGLANQTVIRERQWQEALAQQDSRIPESKRRTPGERTAIAQTLSALEAHMTHNIVAMSRAERVALEQDKANILVEMNRPNPKTGQARVFDMARQAVNAFLSTFKVDEDIRQRMTERLSDHLTSNEFLEYAAHRLEVRFEEPTPEQIAQSLSNEYVNHQTLSQVLPFLFPVDPAASTDRMRSKIIRDVRSRDYRSVANFLVREYKREITEEKTKKELEGGAKTAVGGEGVVGRKIEAEAVAVREREADIVGTGATMPEEEMVKTFGEVVGGLSKEEMVRAIEDPNSAERRVIGEKLGEDKDQIFNYLAKNFAGDSKAMDTLADLVLSSSREPLSEDAKGEYINLLKTGDFQKAMGNMAFKEQFANEALHVLHETQEEFFSRIFCTRIPGRRGYGAG